MDLIYKESEMEFQTPHMEGIHYMAHHTNLIMQALSHLSMVKKFETLLQSLYAYFAHNFKHNLKFTKLAKTLQIKGHKMLINSKTQWILM
jgi:hypothetical protein